MTEYVKSEKPSIENGLRIWVARHSASKQTYPGMLDNTTGGSITSGDELFRNLLREAAEEAPIPIHGLCSSERQGLRHHLVL